jgi:hypothetical protein
VRAGAVKMPYTFLKIRRSNYEMCMNLILIMANVPNCRNDKTNETFFIFSKWGSGKSAGASTFLACFEELFGSVLV